MSKIKAKHLLELGFVREESAPSHNPEENRFHYYTYSINDKPLLITNSNDERVDNGYWVELYDIEGKFVFKKLKKLRKFVKILRSAK